ncbi:MAG: hypothetical protein MHM6MM_006655 [Cercozoa sp. M6MM]
MLLVLLITGITIWVSAQLFRWCSRSTRQAAKPEVAPRPVSREFTLQELQEHNGVQKEQIFLCVRGKVLDVTAGKRFYGPGSSYAHFAGRDVTYAFAMDSLEPSDAEKTCDLTKLTSMQRDRVLQWESQLTAKYPQVGTLKTPAVSPAETKENSPAAAPAKACPFSLKSASQESKQTEAQPAKCPFAQQAQPTFFVDEESLKELSLSELRNGSYVALRGLVFDVSGQPNFEQGTLSRCVGHDISYFVATGATDLSLLDRSIDGLTYQQTAELEAWFRKFYTSLPTVGKLAENVLSGACAAYTVKENADTTPLVTQIETANSLAEIDFDRADVNEPCPRTGMSPLHVAVLCNRVDVVRELLRRGAETQVKAELYDGQTPLELAKRFKHSEIERAFQVID